MYIRCPAREFLNTISTTQKALSEDTTFNSLEYLRQSKEFVVHLDITGTSTVQMQAYFDGTWKNYQGSLIAADSGFYYITSAPFEDFKFVVACPGSNRVVITIGGYAEL